MAKVRKLQKRHQWLKGNEHAIVSILHWLRAQGAFPARNEPPLQGTGIHTCLSMVDENAIKMPCLLTFHMSPSDNTINNFFM